MLRKFNWSQNSRDKILHCKVLTVYQHNKDEQNKDGSSKKLWEPNPLKLTSRIWGSAPTNFITHLQNTE